MKLTFSQFFKKRLEFFKKLPDKVAKLLQDQRKEEAENLIKNFRSGILDDKLGLARLKKKTVRRKKRQGFTNPKKPLVGKGSGSKNSYANMMKASKIIRGYKVAPKAGRHWSGNISLRKLYVYHEDAQRPGTPKRPAMQIVLYLKPPKVPKLKVDPKRFTVKLRK